MIGFQEKYINPFTDFGFKRLFGEEANKDLLKDFLNELLRDNEGEITDLTYLKSEHLGNTALDRKAIFDLYCTNQKGERFIVEIQKTKQAFFKDRALYYATFPIQEQAQRAQWNFELKAVYTIAILDFAFNEDQYDNKVRHEVKLTDIHTKKVFYNKLTFIYLTMPRFTKTLEELETRFDKWLYVIKNLNTLEQLPDRFKEKVFVKFFEVAAVAKLNRDELMAYEDSLKYYRDLKNSLDTAFDDGKEEGREEGREEGSKETSFKIAKQMKEDGIDLKTIKKYTGLSETAIKKL